MSHHSHFIVTPFFFFYEATVHGGTLQYWEYPEQLEIGNIIVININGQMIVPRRRRHKGILMYLFKSEHVGLIMKFTQSWLWEKKVVTIPFENVKQDEMPVYSFF